MATLILEGDNYGTRRRCDATCHNAMNDVCRCICRGLYHGVNRGENRPAKITLEGPAEQMEFLPGFEPPSVPPGL